jgi:hypothetical protein
VPTPVITPQQTHSMAGNGSPRPQQQSRAEAQGQSPHQLVFSPHAEGTSYGASPDTSRDTQMTLSPAELAEERRQHRNKRQREIRKPRSAKKRKAMAEGPSVMAVGAGGSAVKCANGSAAQNDSAFLPSPEDFLGTWSPQQQSRAQAQGQLVFSPPLPHANSTEGTSAVASPGTQMTLNLTELNEARRQYRNQKKRENYQRNKKRKEL